MALNFQHSPCPNHPNSSLSGSSRAESPQPQVQSWASVLAHSLSQPPLQVCGLGWSQSPHHPELTGVSDFSPIWAAPRKERSPQYWIQPHRQGWKSPTFLPWLVEETVSRQRAASRQGLFSWERTAYRGNCRDPSQTSLGWELLSLSLSLSPRKSGSLSF